MVEVSETELGCASLLFDSDVDDDGDEAIGAILKSAAGLREGPICSRPFSHQGKSVR